MKNFEKLSRAEMKNVLGGVAAPPTGGDCCAHNASWSQSNCGYPSASQAEAAATSAAEQDPSQHWYWCCASC
jgi:hypothetical protein